MVERTAALLVLSSLMVVLIGSTVGFAADPDAGGELCVGCSGCEKGECGGEDGSPFGSHHHCCITSCMSHTSFALPIVPSSAAPPMAQPSVMPAILGLTSRTSETPYRPPRV